MDDLTIAIVGLGLIGGSIGLDLSGWSRKRIIRGYDLCEKTLALACRKGAVDVACDLEGAVRGADLVFIAVPVRAIPGVFADMRPFLAPGTRIFDTGSVREWVFTEIERDSLPWEYVGFHPMAGKERGGIERATKGLFRGAPLLISPPLLTEGTRALVLEMAQILGSRVFF